MTPARVLTGVFETHCSRLLAIETQAQRALSPASHADVTHITHLPCLVKLAVIDAWSERNLRRELDSSAKHVPESAVILHLHQWAGLATFAPIVVIATVALEAVPHVRGIVFVRGIRYALMYACGR